MLKINYLGYEEDELESHAMQLAQSLDLQLNKYASPCLFLTEEQLTLKMASFNLLSVDFSHATWSKRKEEGKKQGLVRACKPKAPLKIIDATAGWGRDAAVLASLGAEVLMIERNPIMAALLSDALERRTPKDKECMNLALHVGDALSYLNNLTPAEVPDVIYIDPMHPVRAKAALVKKELQVLQQLIGPDEDALKLIKTAMLCVKQRVVVKWPQKSAPLLPTDSCVAGKTVRFDIYAKN